MVDLKTKIITRDSTFHNDKSLTHQENIMLNLYTYYSIASHKTKVDMIIRIRQMYNHNGRF